MRPIGTGRRRPRIRATAPGAEDTVRTFIRTLERLSGRRVPARGGAAR